MSDKNAIDIALLRGTSAFSFPLSSPCHAPCPSQTFLHHTRSKSRATLLCQQARHNRSRTEKQTEQIQNCHQKEEYPENSNFRSPATHSIPFYCLYSVKSHLSVCVKPARLSTHVCCEVICITICQGLLSLMQADTRSSGQECSLTHFVTSTFPSQIAPGLKTSQADKFGR